MKNTRTCPKCASKRIMVIERKTQDAYIPTSIFSFAIVNKYICADCGFAEEWIASEDDLQKVRDKFLQ